MRDMGDVVGGKKMLTSGRSGSMTVWLYGCVAVWQSPELTGFWEEEEDLRRKMWLWQLQKGRFIGD